MGIISVSLDDEMEIRLEREARQPSRNLRMNGTRVSRANLYVQQVFFYPKSEIGFQA